MAVEPRGTGAAGVTEVVDVLERHLAARRAEVAAVDERLGALADLLVAFVLGGGKRLRPRFALAGWTAVPGAGDPPAEVVRAAAALELIQACALVHDDIVDASDTRRGAPTVHRAAEATARGSDPARYGVAQAILLGDLALAWADDLVVGAGLAPEALARGWEPWSAMKTEVLSGQMLDILAEDHDDADIATARRVNRFKTAAYTVERPLHLGAALAGGDAATTSALRRYGVALGEAFQLRDDLLGVFGDPAVTGKPSGDDIVEGKRTVLVGLALAGADPADAEFLRSALGSEIDERGLARVRGVLERSGAVRAVEAEIDELARAAVAAIAGPEVSGAGRDALTALADAATARVR